MDDFSTKLTYEDLSSLVDEIKQSLAISSVYEATKPDERIYIQDKVKELEAYLGDDISRVYNSKEISEISEITTDITSKLVDDTIQLKKEREKKNG